MEYLDASRTEVSPEVASAEGTSATTPSLREMEALGERIGALAARQTRQEAELLEAIGQFDAAGGWYHQGAISCAHWLGWKLGMALPTGREKVRVARALAELPLIAARFREGSLSYSKVRALTRVAQPNTQTLYLDVADSTTAGQLDRICRRHAAAEDAARAAADPEWVAYRRKLNTQYTDEGWLRMQALLPPDEGARIDQALDATLDRLRATSGPELTRADALLHLLDLGLAQLERDGQVAPPTAELVLHLTEASLADEPSDPDSGDSHASAGGCAVGYLEGPDVPVSLATARRLGCDCAKRNLDLDAGRRTRQIPAPLLRALHHRDAKTCRFPGCTHTRWLHAHHIVHWADGGPTDLDNLVLLCSHHHRQVHEGGFSLDRVGDELRVRDPRGEPVPHLPPRYLPSDPPAEAPEDSGRLEPALMSWEPIDYGQVLDTLIRSSSPAG